MAYGDRRYYKWKIIVERIIKIIKFFWLISDVILLNW